MTQQSCGIKQTKRSTRLLEPDTAIRSRKLPVLAIRRSRPNGGKRSGEVFCKSRGAPFLATSLQAPIRPGVEQPALFDRIFFPKSTTLFNERTHWTAQLDHGA